MPLNRPESLQDPWAILAFLRQLPCGSCGAVAAGAAGAAG